MYFCSFPLIWVERYFLSVSLLYCFFIKLRIFLKIFVSHTWFSNIYFFITNWLYPISHQNLVVIQTVCIYQNIFPTK
jgi:hypothetical protein